MNYQELIVPEKTKQRPDVTELITGFSILNGLNGIYDLKIIYSEVEQNGIFRLHTDNYDHIFFITYGKLLFNVDNKEFEITSGQILNIREGQIHGYRNTTDETVTLLTINIFRKDLLK